MTIRTRLTLLFGLLVASILLLFSVLIYYLYSQYREVEFNQRLEEFALTTARLREDVGDKIPAADLPPLVSEHLTIYDSRNQIIYNLGQGSFPISADLLQKAREGQKISTYRDDIEAVALSYRTRQKEVVVVVAAAYDRYGFSKVSRLRQILIFGWLFSLAIVGVAGWLFAGDALRPVAEITEQVNAISATNIHARLRINEQRDELANLSRTFNAMLNRLEEAFIAQRSFVSHASHELRTPLAVMRGQIEVALMKARTGAEYETTLDEVLDEVKDMVDLVNGLLELARASSDIATISYRPVRIDELLWQARTTILQKKPDYTIDIDFDSLPDQEDDLTLPGEESLLRTSFKNLMENGCKYSANGRVVVRLSFMPGQLQLLFTDQGYGIPAADIPHIFEPFYRSASTQGVSGHGIGLALTQRIINLHKGTIQLDSEEGIGTTVILNFRHEKTTPSGSDYSLLDRI